MFTRGALRRRAGPSSPPLRRGAGPSAPLLRRGAGSSSPPLCVLTPFEDPTQELGIPTANVDSESLHSSLGEAVTGIYAGWVSLGASDEIYKTALSIGYNPHFGDSGALKTCEPWILHDFDGAVFYDQEVRVSRPGGACQGGLSRWLLA